jgi:hypothetical protein
LRLAPDVNVRVATEIVGGRKIAHDLHRFRTPCCTPTVRLKLDLAAQLTQRAGSHASHAAKNLSHLGRWDGNFPRPTFLEAGGTDFPAAIS